MLDPRPSRNDLTSRECSKIISAVLFSVATLFGDDAVEQVLKYFTEASGSWEIFRQIKTGEPNRLLLERAKKERETYLGSEMCPVVAAELVIGGVIGGLMGMAKESAVRTAVEWVAEHQKELLANVVAMIESQYE